MPLYLHDLELTEKMISYLDSKLTIKFLEKIIEKISKKKTTQKTKEDKVSNFKIMYETKSKTSKRIVTGIILPDTFRTTFVDEHTSHQRWIWLLLDNFKTSILQEKKFDFKYTPLTSTNQDLNSYWTGYYQAFNSTEKINRLYPKMKNKDLKSNCHYLVGFYSFRCKLFNAIKKLNPILNVFLEDVVLPLHWQQIENTVYDHTYRDLPIFKAFCNK